MTKTTITTTAVTAAVAALKVTKPRFGRKTSLHVIFRTEKAGYE